MHYRALKEAVAAAVESADARRSGTRARVLCPKCVSSKTNRADYSMSVSLEEGWFFCQRCGAKGKLWESVTGIVNSMVPPVREFRVARGIPVSQAVVHGSVFAKRLWEFITSRRCQYIVHAPNVTCHTGNSGADIRFVVEMFRVDDLEVPACAQYIDCYEYRSSWATSKRTALGGDRASSFYNAVELTRPTRRPVLVVEGFFDAVAHLPDAVAVMGVPSNTHIEMLAFAPRPVVLALDGDAWERGWVNAQHLRHMGQMAASIHLPPKCDPDDFTRGELMRKAIDALLDE